MQMIKNDKNINDVIFVLDNLRNEDILELQALWGNDWKQSALDNIIKHDFLTLIGKNDKNLDIPIAVGGFAELFEKNASIACVWLLTSSFISYNKKSCFNQIKKTIKQAESKYFVMYNYIYKSNFQAKKWLKNLGFCFDKPKPDNIIFDENFEFFYKINY